MLLVAVEPDRIRQQAAEVLAQYKYARWRSNGEIPKWLREWIEWFFDLLSGSPDVSGVTRFVFWLAVVAVAVFLIAHIVRGLRAAQGAHAAASMDPPAPISIDLLAQGDSLARQGRFLDAAHCLQLACIKMLLDRGLLELGRSDPNRILRRRLRASGLASAEVSDLCFLLDRMEASWFRSRRDDPSLFESWRALYLRLDDGAARA